MSTRRPWARPLVPLYAAALRAKNALRSSGIAKTRALKWPVISVGSISAGGAGKTPVVIALAKLLLEHGWTVDVLSRGYGRAGHGIEKVQTALDTAATSSGDEPVLIAQKTSAPVWVGADRFEAGTQAEAANGTTEKAVHLLDDGFQHRQLARTLDIVVVTAEDLDDALLPAGNLRENVSTLQRADVIVVREDEFEHIGKRVWPLVKERAQMWTVRRTLRFPAPLFVFGAGLRPIAFCAIARPENFASMLQNAGCGIIETVAFADHHRYTLGDIHRIITVAKSLNGSGFVTTEKDAVKLTTVMRERLQQFGPLIVAQLDADFADTETVLRALETKLKAGAQ